MEVIEELRSKSRLPARQFNAKEHLLLQVPLERLQDLAKLAPRCAAYHIDTAVTLMAPSGIFSLIWLFYYSVCTCLRACIMLLFPFPRCMASVGVHDGSMQV